MKRLPSFALILLAAGSSERFNRDNEEGVKKEFLEIDGHSVLYRAAEPFFELPGLSAVIVACQKDAEDETIVALEDLVNVNSIPFLLVEGGATRKESVRISLERLGSLSMGIEYVAIHDGARPYIKPDMIINTLATATITGAAVPAIRITDSIKRLGADGFISDNVDRTGLVRVQTPQIFRFDQILNAHRNFKGESASDDVEVYTASGYRCAVVQGSDENKKITYLKDIPDVENQIASYRKAREEGRKSKDASKRMRELLFKPGESDEDR